MVFLFVFTKIGKKFEIKRAAFSENIFGEPLALSMLREKPDAKIPTFLEECFQIIESKTKTEGLFRKSGGQANIELISQKINECQDTSKVKDILSGEGIHDITGLIKLYFRSTLDPLIPFRFYPVIQKIVQLPETNERLFSMKRLLHTFPQLNFRIMGRFMECIKKILMESETNKMTIGNSNLR